MSTEKTSGGNGCVIRILSRTDGKSSLFALKGTLTVEKSGFTLRYKQDESTVTIKSEGEYVTMTREGEFFIKLCFSAGMTVKGEIGLSPEARGEVETYTRRAASFRYANDKKVKIILEYTLRFSSGETQETFLQLLAERAA